MNVIHKYWQTILINIVSDIIHFYLMPSIFNSMRFWTFYESSDYTTIFLPYFEPSVVLDGDELAFESSSEHYQPSRLPVLQSSMFEIGQISVLWNAHMGSTNRTLSFLPIKGHRIDPPVPLLYLRIINKGLGCHEGEWNQSDPQAFYPANNSSAYANNAGVPPVCTITTVSSFPISPRFTISINPASVLPV